MIYRSVVATLCSVLLLPVVAASAPSSSRPSFEETTSVVEVKVPVQVLDRKGRPIRGLSAEDFRIVDEGEERRIASFELVDLEGLTSVEGGMLDRVEDVPAAARRYFLFLFDLSFSTPGSILRARAAAREFVLEKLHPSDLAAVMVFSNQRGPRLLVTFTPDRAQVARAIDLVGVPDLLEKHGSRDPLSFIIEDPALVRDRSDVAVASEQESRAVDVLEEEMSSTARVIHKQIDRQNKAWDRGRITSWATSLEELGKVLGNVEGRKHVIYFSEGFDGRLVLGRGADGFDESIYEDRRNLNYGRYWMVDMNDIYGETAIQSDIREMLSSFKRSNAVIQTIDISGLRAEHAPALRGREVGQHVLFYVANETGGQLFSDANRFGEQLARILESTEVTYLLTFEADDVVADGSYHELEVEVDGPRGTRVSHREGYYAPRPYNELHPFEKKLLTARAIATASPREEISLSVLASPFLSSSRKAYVPVIVEIPGEDLLAGHEPDALPVEIYAYVTDEKGEMVDFFTQSVQLDLSKGREQVLSAGFKYYGHLNLDSGDHLLRVLVRNGATGRSGVETVPISVPSRHGAEPFVLGPFFPERRGGWILLRERTEDPESESVVYPFTVEGDPYVPAASAEVSSGDSARLVLVGYHLEGGEVSLTGRILDRDGSEVQGGKLEMLGRDEGGFGAVDKFVARFTPEGLPPGLYDLEITLRSEKTSRTTRAPVRIR